MTSPCFSLVRNCCRDTSQPTGGAVIAKHFLERLKVQITGVTLSFLRKITPAFPVFLHPISWSSLPHFCDKRAFRTGLIWEVERSIFFLELLINILHCYISRVLSMSLTAIMSASQGWWTKENPTLPRGDAPSHQP